MPPEPATPGLDASAQSAFLARVNALLAGRGRVSAYALLPPALWDGPYGAFLSQSLGHRPDQPWNTMLLAADPRSARALGLPETPAAYPDGFLDAAEAWVANLAADVLTAQRAVVDHPDASVAFRRALKAASDSLFAFAHASAVKQFGEPAYQAHLALFGELLRWEHRERFLKSSSPLKDRDGAHRVSAQFSGRLSSPDVSMLATASTSQMLDRLTASVLVRDRLVEAVNARLAPQATIKAYNIIPPALWDKETCEFLTGPLNAYPAGRGNTLLLPTDAASAAVLGLPVHPGAAGEATLRLAQREVRRAKSQLAAELRDEAALRFGFQAFLRAQAVEAIGEAAWLKHAGIFGAVLDPDAHAA